MLTFDTTMANPADYLPPAPRSRGQRREYGVAAPSRTSGSPQNFAEKVENVIAYVEAQGFVFEPWQIAAFITAVRTKPFVILAGISGTGKTKLPRIVAEATGAISITVPVQPSWSDSTDLLGFERLDGSYRPGSLLSFAKAAEDDTGTQYFFVLDEMNIARVEYYLAEVLTQLEEMRPDENGRRVSGPLKRDAGTREGIDWSRVRLVDNLCIVGSVNMDETTFGFSKKVLDRAFVIEFSNVNLSAIGSVDPNTKPAHWTSSDWQVAALSLANHPERDSAVVKQIIEVLTEVNEALEMAQLQFGYRVRDEIVLFCLAARECADAFVSSDGGPVDPLDLAIAMKVLPRIQGGGTNIRNVLERLDEWASPKTRESTDEPGMGGNVKFPFCAARIALMLRRLEAGYTSFWL